MRDLRESCAQSEKRPFPASANLLGFLDMVRADSSLLLAPVCVKQLDAAMQSPNLVLAMNSVVEVVMVSVFCACRVIAVMNDPK